MMLSIEQEAFELEKGKCMILHNLTLTFFELGACFMLVLRKQLF
ncbi:hypothetical protein Bsph_2465 [Lysinibacillus sphaericus C3-41]|uniref:Uncharacterized protein n=1 Tax=Lysinibacillus sphaericus (strain C3-41) TaxID=444177 RepID=B1HXP3_LYSSC|nr:hypothetical protein Bsph_2465 [Lysinibacillus sphaericus C3-41]